MVDINKNIKDFRPGQKQLSAAHMNQLTKAARRTFVGTSGINVHQTGSTVQLSLDDKFVNNNWWLGKLWSNGNEPVVFTDEHYYAFPAEIDSELTASDLVFSDVYFPSDIPVIVTNLTEIAGGTHLLSDAQVVVVFESKDAGTPPVTRYVMSEDTASADTATSVAASDSWIQVTQVGSVYHLAHETSDAAKNIGCFTSDACTHMWKITGLRLDKENHVTDIAVYMSDGASGSLTIWNKSDVDYPA